MEKKSIRRIEQYQDMMSRLFPKDFISKNGERKLVRTVTFQVTDACNLSCTYCYQINKGKRRMPIDIAFRFVDYLLQSTPENNPYINPVISPAIIVEFIGGEPFLEIQLISNIVDYWMKRCIELRHPWAENVRFSICSNGVLYFSKEVQDFLNKWKNKVSFSISIDGNKELHDSCRIFPDGRPSYDIAVAGAMDYMSKGGNMGSKTTLAPENIIYTYQAIKHMYELGYRDLNANCVYETDWTTKHARILYDQMIQLADFFINQDDTRDTRCSLFEENFFKPMEETDNQNWCWGKGTPILTVNGYKPIEEIEIGDLVYTEDGTVHPVINIMSHFANNVVEISASGIFNLVCTDNHKVYAKPFDFTENKKNKYYKKYDKYEVKNLKSKDLIRLFQFPDQSVEYDTDLAYLIGRYIGDGWDYRNNKGHAICCGYHESKDLENAFKKANIDYHINNNKTAKQYTISYRKKNKNNELCNDELHRILKHCGHLASGKHLPPECFNWSKKSLQALLDGYLSADGYTKKNGIIAFNTVSYRLAQELMVLLRTLGYTPTCYKNKRNGRSIILGREVLIKDRYEVYFRKDNSKSRYIKKENSSMWTSNLKKKSVEPQVVYNITVETNHSYIAGGLISSNCGGTGMMLSCDPEGRLYPCIRYMESSLGCSIKPIVIGDVWRGIGATEEQKYLIQDMKNVTRRSQSTDECFYCPIAAGCSWCSAYNYQETGSYNKRVTKICIMHKARSLANVYYWNKFYKKLGWNQKFKMNIPKEWALEIISEDEWNMLVKLSE